MKKIFIKMSQILIKIRDMINDSADSVLYGWFEPHRSKRR